MRLRPPESEVGVELPESEELHALQEAAACGDAVAQATLGLAHELGHVVARDVLYAAYLYRQAALSGERRAQFSLGLLYELGVGIAANADLALPWYARAAAHGHDEARRRLDQLVLATLPLSGATGTAPSGEVRETSPDDLSGMRIGRQPPA